VRKVDRPYMDFAGFTNMFRDCRAFNQVLPWKADPKVGMFYGSHGSLLEVRSPGTIRQRNQRVTKSIHDMSLHPSMIDPNSLSPIEADNRHFQSLFHANLKKDLLAPLKADDPSFMKYLREEKAAAKKAARASPSFSSSRLQSEIFNVKKTGAP
jgi:hypothetical protein